MNPPFSILKDFQAVRLLLIIRPRIDFSVIFIIYKLEQLFGCVFTEREIKICPLGGAGGIFSKERKMISQFGKFSGARLEAINIVPKVVSNDSNI